jgi:hypothetical protein
MRTRLGVPKGVAWLAGPACMRVTRATPRGQAGPQPVVVVCLDVMYDARCVRSPHDACVVQGEKREAFVRWTSVCA